MFSKFSAVVVVEYEVENYFDKSQKGNILFSSFFHLS